MAGSQKQKFLALLEILYRYTDEDHPLSAPRLIEMLAERGIACERKAVYRDIESLTAFGFEIIKIDGHDFDDIEKAFNKFHKNHGSDKPTVILMKTTKGKGISFMEDDAGWHGKAPNDEQYAQGMAELAAARKQIEEA